MKKVIVVLSLVLALGYFVKIMNDYQAENGGKTETNSTTESSTPNSTAETKASVENANTSEQSYTLDEVRQHNTSTDCYMAIKGKVYDLTPYITGAFHPGGNMIVKGCGIDVTSLFTTRSGGGHMHSAMATQLLTKYEIGTLVN
jgi:cytochrome b involved in lipid metabolism